MNCFSEHIGSDITNYMYAHVVLNFGMANVLDGSNPVSIHISIMFCTDVRNNGVNVFFILMRGGGSGVFIIKLVIP